MVAPIPIAINPLPKLKPSRPSIGALTTWKLFEALEGKGYQKAIGTLRRSLKVAIETGHLSDDLSNLGVMADFGRSANPKDALYGSYFWSEGRSLGG